MTPSPQVSVTAIANGNEIDGSPAVFRFSRTGSTTAPLSVSYLLLGTAQAGSDYSGAASGTISFSAGSATAELSLPALADSVIDPGETIIAQIVHSTAATPSYLITPGQQTATATITAEGMVVTVNGPSQTGWSKGETANPRAFAALKSDGSVVSWGDAGSGGMTPAGLSGVTQIFSTNWAFAALKSDGTVVSWGNTRYGGTTPAGLGGVTQIFSNGQAFAALKSDGTVVSWGNASYGGTTPAGLSGVTQIFSTGNAFAALRNDGTVVSWGAAPSGLISIGGGVMVTPIITPAGLSGVTQIFSNSYAFAALKSDGTVVSWGSPIYGGRSPAGLSSVVGFANPFTNDRLLLATTTAAVTAITDNVGIIQGTVASGATTDDTSLGISGTISAALAAGESVRIYDGTTLLGNASVIGTTWSYADTRLLGNNQSVSYTARVVNVAGNQSASSKAYTATFDQVAPTTTATIIAMADNVGLIKGNVADGASTDDTTPTFSGTLSAPLAKGETLRLFNGSTLLGSATVNNTSKTWSFTPKALPTTTGTSYAITTRVADAAGNLGDASASRGFFLDTTAPAAGTLSLIGFTDSGRSATDRITNDRDFSLSLSGQEASSSVAYQRSTDGGKTWSNTAAGQSSLADGTSQFRALVTDLAGNNAYSTRQSVTVDTAAAAGTLSLIDFFDSGSSVTDRITNDRDFSLSLSGQEAGSTVVYQRSTDGGYIWANTTFGQGSLAHSTYQFRAIVTDPAGNTAYSTNQSVTVDASAPATTAAITDITDDVGHLGTLTADDFTDDPTPTISGTVSAALASGDSLHVYNGATFLGSASVTSTTWSFTPSALANGFYAVTARVADAAGNLGAASTGQRFSLDATANQVIGDANNNILNASSAKDVITGYVGADTFSFATPSTSTLASFDRITDFNIGTDLLDGPTAVTAANINKLGAVSGLNTTSIGNLLTCASFLADRAATFTYADPSGISRRFIALNDGYAGFDASSDGIVEITGYTGLIANLAVI